MVNTIAVHISSDFEHISNDKHIEFINSILDVEDSLSSSIGFHNINYARIDRCSMSPEDKEKRDDLKKLYTNDICFERKSRPGYYNNLVVYDCEKLKIVYYHMFLRIIGVKYNDAVMAVNSYPYYRI